MDKMCYNGVWMPVFCNLQGVSKRKILVTK